MARFWGKIGIKRNLQETAPGVLKREIEEIEVSGEIRNLSVRWSEQSQGDRLSLRHVLSILTPEDSDIDFTEVVYIIWKSRKWTVTSIEYKPPRVELGLGGLYNG